ncbi:MAG TPA: ROK family transcriptional regulator [Microlunatus sp.]
MNSILDRVVLEALFEHGPLTRPEIEERTGLSKPAAARLLLRVEEAGPVRRAGDKPSRSGPPAVLWQINNAVALVAGLVVDAGQLEAEIRNLDGDLVGRGVADNAVAQQDEIGTAIRTVIEKALQRTGHPLDAVSDITLGLPGIVDPDRGRLRHSTRLPVWEGVDLIAAVTDALPQRRVFTGNDVSLVAMAEYEYGSAAEAQAVALLWVGAGTRIAFLRDGQLMLGRHGLAGEIGSLVAPDFGAVPAPTPHKLARPVPGGGVFLEQLLHNSVLAQIGDDVEALAERLAVGLAAVTSILDPELIVLAGPSVEQHGDALVQATANALTFMPHEVPRVTRAALGRSAALRGATLLSLRSARRHILSTGSRGPHQVTSA